MSYIDLDRRVELGIDGNFGFALLGDDIQIGECEFVEVEPATEDISASRQQRIACNLALDALKIRLNAPNLSFFFGPSHPFN